MKSKDPVWGFYTVTVNGKKTTAICNDCKNEVSAKADRLKVHREKCPSLATQGSKKRPEPVGDVPQKTTTTQVEAPTTCTTEQPTKRLKLQQSQINSYGCQTDARTKIQLDHQIARLFYACNLPFNIASHPEWKKTIEMLRPGYQGPNRKDLGGALLDTVHEKLVSHVKTEVEGKDVVMMQDGWSDIHNTPVIATSLHTGEKSYFMTAVETGTNKKTADYCTSIAQDAIHEANEKYGCNVTGVVTDNEKKMEAMRRNLKDDDPSLTVYGCSAHWLNLLGQDITPTQVINQVVEINKYFRNHHIPGALLAEIAGSVKPQLPADTRWNSQLACTETFIRNRPFMLLIVAQNEDVIDTRIRSLIHNVGLFSEVKHLQTQLQPISRALDSFQSDTATIADACEQWNDLLQNPDLEPYRKNVDKRFKQAMTPNHYLANLVHPIYKGRKLRPEHVTSAQELLHETKPELVPELLNYMSETLPIPKVLQQESSINNTKPAVWWSCVERSGVITKDFSQLARKLMVLPASSAAIERVFSNFGIIQTKLRNRLGVEKAAKLVLCYCFLRGSEEIDW